MKKVISPSSRNRFIDEMCFITNSQSVLIVESRSVYVIIRWLQLRSAFV